MEKIAYVQDGPYINAFTGTGTLKDRSSRTGLCRKAILSQSELETLYQFDGYARKIIDKPVNEMLRSGFDINNFDHAQDLIADLEDMGLNAKLADALRWRNLYGGSMIVLIINDIGLLEDPLNEESIKSIDQIRVYDRWQVTRHHKYQDPSDTRYGQTEIYMISPEQGMSYNVHATRCIKLDGEPLPNLLREQNDGWGASKLQQCYDRLVNLSMAEYWSNGLLERAQQAVHGIKGLSGLLASSNGQEQVRARVDAVDMVRSMQNTVIIDAEEEFDLKSTSFAGIPDMIDRHGVALAGVADMPESVLFGRQIGGLSSTGKSDLENWYSTIATMQNDHLLPVLDRILTIQMKVRGWYVDDYLIKFKELFVPSEKERSETMNKDADSMVKLVESQIITTSDAADYMNRTWSMDIDLLKLPDEIEADPDQELMSPEDDKKDI